MENIKKFIDCFVPVYKCNFKCEYCYISTWKDWKQEKYSEEVKYDIKTIRKAFSKERWGGPVMINFCAAGETLLCKELVPIIKELLEEGHYCMIVTNGSLTAKFKELAEFPQELKNHLFIKFSFHYLELKKLNLIEKYFNNVELMKENGISYTIELTPSDIYIPYIQEIKDICLEKVGALPHLTVCRKENGNVPIMSKLNKEEYIETWKSFESDLFDFKMSIFGIKRKEFCYAGSWSYVLNLVDGNLRQCYRGKVLQNIFKNTNEPIKEEPIGCNCQDAHCWNGHAFLTFGDIPELKTPTFEKVRNKKTSKGDWITKQMAEFMSTKLYDNNRQLTEEEKYKYNKKSEKVVKRNEMRKKIKNVVKKVIRKKDNSKEVKKG